MKREKTKEELLISYKRRNKIAREKMAINAGFKTGTDYVMYLVGVDGTKPAKAKKESKKESNIVIHNVHILDRSGSMNGNRIRTALKGINQDMTSLSKEPVEVLQSIVVFDDDILRSHWRESIDKIGNFKTTTRGCTALNQAIGETLERLIDDIKPNERTIVKVFTDGGENSSRGQYARPGVVKSMIDLAAENGIMVTFVGTKWEVEYAVNRLGVSTSNTMVHDNTASGIQATFSAASVGTKSYVTRSMTGETVLEGFYKTIETLD